MKINTGLIRGNSARADNLEPAGKIAKGFPGVCNDQD